VYAAFGEARWTPRDGLPCRGPSTRMRRRRSAGYVTNEAGQSVFRLSSNGFRSGPEPRRGHLGHFPGSQRVFFNASSKLGLRSLTTPACSIYSGASWPPCRVPAAELACAPFRHERAVAPGIHPRAAEARRPHRRGAPVSRVSAAGQRDRRGRLATSIQRGTTGGRSRYRSRNDEGRPSGGVRPLIYVPPGSDGAQVGRLGAQFA
jgi:hypothetical protein